MNPIIKVPTKGSFFNANNTNKLSEHKPILINDVIFSLVFAVFSSIKDQKTENLFSLRSYVSGELRVGFRVLRLLNRGPYTNATQHQQAT